MTYHLTIYDNDITQAATAGIPREKKERRTLKKLINIYVLFEGNKDAIPAEPWDTTGCKYHEDVSAV